MRGPAGVELGATTLRLVLLFFLAEAFKAKGKGKDNNGCRITLVQLSGRQHAVGLSGIAITADIDYSITAGIAIAAS